MLELIKKALGVLVKMLRKQAAKDQRSIDANVKEIEQLRMANSASITHKTRCKSLAKRIDNLLE